MVVHLKTGKDLNFTLDDEAATELEDALESARVFPRGESVAEFDRFFDVICVRTNRKYFLDFSQIASVVVGDFIDYSKNTEGVETITKAPIRRPFADRNVK